MKLGRSLICRDWLFNYELLPKPRKMIHHWLPSPTPPPLSLSLSLSLSRSIPSPPLNLRPYFCFPCSFVFRYFSSLLKWFTEIQVLSNKEAMWTADSIWMVTCCAFFFINFFVVCGCLASQRDPSWCHKTSEITIYCPLMALYWRFNEVSLPKQVLLVSSGSTGFWWVYFFAFSLFNPLFDQATCCSTKKSLPSNVNP